MCQLPSRPPVLHAYFRASVSWVALEAERRDYDTYRCMAERSDEDGGKRLLRKSIWMHCLRRTCCWDRRLMLVV